MAEKRSRRKATGTCNLERQLIMKKPRKSKSMNKKERDNLIASISGVDLSILSTAVQDKLNEELSIPGRLKHLSKKLCENEVLLEAIIVAHHDLFISKIVQSHI